MLRYPGGREIGVSNFSKRRKWEEEAGYENKKPRIKSEPRDVFEYTE
jgi:hypothetical protein